MKKFLALIVLSTVVATILNPIPSSFAAPTPKPSITSTSQVKAPLGASVTRTTFTFNSHATKKLDIWEDFQCLNCGVFERANGAYLSKLISAGSLQVIYHPLSFIGLESQRLANAAACAADQNKFLQFHKLAFDSQSTKENSGLWTTTYLLKKASSIGLNSVSFTNCVQKASYSDWLVLANQSSKTAGISATPAVFLNGKPLNRATDYSDPTQFQKIVENPELLISASPLPSPSPFALSFAITHTFGVMPVVDTPVGAPPADIGAGDLTVGTGEAAQSGDSITIQYSVVDWGTGKTITSTWKTGPTMVQLSKLLPGLQAGIPGMKVGGRRVVVLPPKWAYGSQGTATVPANATLIFVIDLLATTR